MNEDFVSFELAKKLKEKGFNLVTRYGYLPPIKLIHEAFTDKDWSKVNGCSAPTISQVLKWLREEKRRHLLISTYHHTPFNVHDWGYDIINLRSYNVEHYDYGYNSYEEAAIAGIEYVLDNLI